jgi:hypothetical protein
VRLKKKGVKSTGCRPQSLRRIPALLHRAIPLAVRGSGLLRDGLHDDVVLGERVDKVEQVPRDTADGAAHVALVPVRANLSPPTSA